MAQAKKFVWVEMQKYQELTDAMFVSEVFSHFHFHITHLSESRTNHLKLHTLLGSSAVIGECLSAHIKYYTKFQLRRVFNYIIFKPCHMQSLDQLLSYPSCKLTGHLSIPMAGESLQLIYLWLETPFSFRDK